MSSSPRGRSACSASGLTAREPRRGARQEARGGCRPRTPEQSASALAGPARVLLSRNAVALMACGALAPACTLLVLLLALIASIALLLLAARLVLASLLPFPLPLLVRHGRSPRTA